MSDDEAALDLVTLLARWHREVEQAVAELEAGPRRGSTLTSDELQARNTSTRRLRYVVLPRETLKQRHLWPAIRRHVTAGDRLVADLNRSKLAVENTMLKLRWVDERSEWIEDLLEQLAHQVRMHVAVERGALPRLRAELPPGVQADLAEQLGRPHRLLPVQPHPDLPTTPLAAALLAPILGVVDRVRDAVTTAPG